MAERRVLCFASWYLPGFRAGGPVRSLMRLCEWLKDDFDFRIVTRNCDLGHPEPYADKLPDVWYPAGGTPVTYLPKPHWSPGRLRRIVRECQADLLYFHSFLDPSLVAMPLALRRLGLLGPRTPVLVAPRGEFSPGALGLKKNRKVAWLRFVRLLQLFENVSWQATDENEAALIRSLWGRQARVLIAPNLPPKVDAGDEPARQAKLAGALRLVFLSRISPMKNLQDVLSALAAVRQPVSLDIYGTTEDATYWRECEQQIGRLPASVTVRYRGPVQPEQVIAVLAGYDVFILPTLGENFGHVILEALLAGCPLLISDRTPWRDLAARGIGFDLPLGRPAAFGEAIGRFAAMDGTEFGAWSRAAREAGLRYCHNADLARVTREVLAAAMDRFAGARPGGT
ncbi:MAG: glycosyltransferase family 4 protein [Gammaproteobacteria bacterium]